MRIRSKLLILLLGIALVPVIFVSLYSQHSTRRLGGEVAGKFADTLIEQARSRLVRMAHDDAALVRAEGERLLLAVRMQVREVERLLASSPAAGPQVHFAREFDDARTLPAGAGPISEKHFRIGADGEVKRLPISLETSSFWIAPGVSPQDVAQDIARLAPLLSLYREIHESHADMIHWQYTALESGVHCTYPAHGGYPDNYDPRRRAWYAMARERGEPTWSPPIVDVSTRQIMMTISAPVKRPDGSFAGVTAIDLRLIDVLRLADLPDEWQAQGEVLVVAFEKDGPGDRLLVVSQRKYLEGSRSWDTPVDVSFLKQPGAEFRSLLSGIARGESGVLRMPFEGRDCLWGYGALTLQQSALLLVVPHESILAEAVASEETTLDRIQQQLFAAGATFLVVVGVVVLLALRASRKVTRPVSVLAKAAHRVAAGDFEARADVESKDELGDLASTFNDMVPQLRERLKLRESLSLAMEVQQNLLPKHPPVLEGFDIAGASIYCDETGGDYYDYLEIAEEGPGRLAVAVGDVTGHGIAPALLMATARALVRSRAPDSDDLAELVGQVNRHLTRDSAEGRFMTLYLLLVETGPERYRWVSAGHDAALVYDPAEDRFSELKGTDIPLGIEESWDFTEYRREGFTRGEVMLIGTDGIWETRNEASELFGKERLMEVIRTNREAGAEKIMHAITHALDLHRNRRPQEDDVTLVVLKRVG